MGMLIMAGRDANVFASARSVTPATAENSLFPVANMVDGVPGIEGAFNAAAAGQSLTFDNSISHADMEGTFPASGWSNASTGSGAVAQSNTFAHGGTYSARVTGGASGVGIYRLTKTVRTGFRYRLSVWARDTATATAKVRIYNAETRNHLQASGTTWSAASADVATTATTSFVQLTPYFTVESFSACGRRDRVTLYIDLVCTQNEYVYFDDFDLWPEVDFVGVFGHNIDAGMAPTIRSSTDNFGAVDVLEATLAVQKPAFYKKLSAPITSRYVRVVFPTANVLGAPRIGELFGSQYLAPQRDVSAVVGEFEVSTDRRQIVSDYQAFLLSDDPETSLVMPMQLLSLANYKEVRDEIIERSRGSASPLVVVPEDTLDPDLVVMGRLAGKQAYRRLPLAIRETSLIVEGLPYATVVS